MQDEACDNENQFKFMPPLYLQRYDFVIELLNKYSCKSMLDIGCMNCLFANYNNELFTVKPRLILHLELKKFQRNSSRHRIDLMQLFAKKTIYS
jgi:hypothetical protein